MIVGCILANGARRSYCQLGKQKRGRSKTVAKAGNATNILNIVDASSWWVGRVHVMRWCNGKHFGVLRQAVDLLA